MIRDIAPHLSYFGGSTLRWSPDGEELLVRGRGFDNVWGLYAVHALTGAARALVVSDGPGQEQGTAFEWPTDDRVVYVHIDGRLIERNLTNNSDRVLIAGETRVNGFGFSPDGSRIAVSAVSGEGDTRKATLEVLELDGRKRLIQTRNGPGVIVFQFWARDGQDLVYATNAPKQLPRLWRIAATGDTPVDLQITLDSSTGMYFAAGRPDGKEILYTSGSLGVEVWKKEQRPAGR